MSYEDFLSLIEEVDSERVLSLPVDALTEPIVADWVDDRQSDDELQLL